MDVYKRKAFAHWQRYQKIPDSALCQAAKELESGLVDADLGSFLYKKRISRDGQGKSGGYRVLLTARIGSRYVFLYGFSKNDRANITRAEIKALQYAGKVFLNLAAAAMEQALQTGILSKVDCNEQTH